MKKAINIFLFILCFTVISCHDDDTAIPALSIIKTDTNLKATGGEASVQIQAVGEVKATTDVEWCKVTEVTTEIVRLSVQENKDYPGRSAQIIITNGDQSREVTLIQEGAILIYNKSEQIQSTDNEAAVLPIKLSSSFPIQVSIPEENKDWLSFSPSADGKGGSFVVSENKTGKARGSDVTVTAGKRTLTYQIMQYDAENFVGDWKGTYVNQGKQYSLPEVSISAQDENGIYTISGLYKTSAYDYKIQATYQNNMFNVAAGQFVGSNVSSGLPLSVYFCIVDGMGLPLFTADNSIGLIPVLLPDGSFVLAFADNGGVPGGVATKISFAGFLGEPSLNSFQGNIRILSNCFFF